MIVFCILDCLILVWNIAFIVHAFVTKNVIWTTWSLMAVALWLLVTMILNLRHDLKNRKRIKRYKVKICELCGNKVATLCDKCSLDRSMTVKVTEAKL